MLHAEYNGHPVHLVEDIREFEIIRKLINPKVTLGLDTETTGLTWFKDKVVGICVSCGISYNPKDYHGFYLPIRHVNYDKNLDIPTTIAFIQELIDTYKTAWWNRAFDAQMLEQDGITFPCVGHTHDVQCMAHLVLNEHMPALKPYAAKYLKYDVIEFSTNKAEAGNFATTNPQVSFIYGSQDPIVTALLGRKLWTEFPYIQKIYKLDNLTAEVMRRFMRDAELYIDKNKVQELLDKTNARLAAIKSEVFAITGYQFKLNSNRDKADALSRVVTLTKKTKGGQFAVNEEALAEIDHPLARLLVEYAQTEKLRGSYLQKFMDFPIPFHVAYQTCNVPSGRFSSGASKGNEYFSPVNIQNIPKEECYKYLVPDPIIGWRASDSPEGAVGKVKCKASLRACFIPPEGYVWAAFDYAAEEVRILGNMAHEPGLLEPIKNGEDIHKYVATKMFGHYDPTQRTIAKQITFCSNYGGGAYTIAQRLGVSQEEGERLLKLYNESLPNVTRWKEEIKKTARKTGFVFTYMGRPQALWPIYNNPAPGMKAFGDRSAMNRPIQGSGGDLIRLVHCKLFKKFETDPEFAANVKYAMNVHDEIDIFVKPEYLKKASDVMMEIMYFKPAEWEVPIVTEPSVGWSWDTIFDNDGIDENNKVILKDYQGKDIAELQAKFREENPELFKTV